jgi:hypothetical protein
MIQRPKFLCHSTNMDEREFHEAVVRIVREDPRFSPDAYPFVVQALTRW